ncbi:MAG TPA: hypothetical protein VG318_17680 [Actinomycetota bacterium]|nr:hypothetical protein [Actinomycetota bacterium]
MLSRTRRVAATVAAVLAVAGGMAAPTAAAAEGPCQAAVSQSTGSEIAIVLEGHFTYSGSNSALADANLTCHIVQNGVPVVTVSDQLVGPTAITVTDQRIDPDPYHVCYALEVVWTIWPHGPRPVEYPATSDC